MSREEARVAVAFRAGVRQFFAGHRGLGFARDLHRMDIAMARHAVWGVGIAFFFRLSVNTFRKLLEFLSVALVAFVGREICGCGKFLRTAVEFAQAVSPSAKWTLVEKSFVSCSWQVAHWTFAILAECGKSLMLVWQA